MLAPYIFARLSRQARLGLSHPLTAGANLGGGGSYTLGALGGLGAFYNTPRAWPIRSGGGYVPSGGGGTMYVPPIVFGPTLGGGGGTTFVPPTIGGEDPWRPGYG